MERHNSVNQQRPCKRHAVVGGMVVLAALLFAGDAWAQGGPGGRGPGPGQGQGRMARLAQHLELTTEQRQQIRALRQQMQQELEPTQAQIRQVQQQIRAEWLSEQPNERDLLTLHRELSSLRQVVQDRQIRFRLAVHALLTPEQQQRAAELAERRMARGEAGLHGPGGPGRMGRRGHQGQQLEGFDVQ